MDLTRNSGAKLLSEFAALSLIEEAELSPKPGLVDSRSGGSHSDMSVGLMLLSANALRPYFEEMARVSWGRTPGVELREEIGLIGREAEAAMFKATSGVNTHKGAIWSLGLLVSAAAGSSLRLSDQELLERAGKIAQINDRFVPLEVTHGTQVKAKYRCHGAKEEAQHGFPHIRKYGLPFLRRSLRKGEGKVIAELNSLLAVLTSLNDTCVLYRGGVQALRETQEKCRSILLAGGVGNPRGQMLLSELDGWMQETRISPGGAADLLGATLFVNRLSHIQ